MCFRLLHLLRPNHGLVHVQCLPVYTTVEKCMVSSSLKPPSSTVSTLSTTVSGGAPNGLIETLLGNTKLSISDAPSVTGVPLVYPPFHYNMDAFSVSLHDFLLSTPVIPLALSALHMEWTCEKLVLPSILLTDFNKSLVLRSYASLILSSHGTVSSHRNACFVAADQMTSQASCFWLLSLMGIVFYSLLLNVDVTNRPLPSTLAFCPFSSSFTWLTNFRYSPFFLGFLMFLSKVLANSASSLSLSPRFQSLWACG